MTPTSLKKESSDKTELTENLEKVLLPNPCTPGRVAVILPVYNVEKYLESCIRSILSQTYTNFDIIAVNDGSTDQSMAILQKLANSDPRIKIISQPNGGLSSARNSALNRIYSNNEYDYLSFIDSDDIIRKDFLSQHISRLESDQTDVSVCCYAQLYDTGEMRQSNNFCKKKILSQKDFLELVFSLGQWRSDSASGGMVWKSIYRTSAIKGTTFINDRSYLDDEPFCLQIAQKIKRFSYIANSLYFYRQRSTPSSLISQPDFQERLLKARHFCVNFGKRTSPEFHLICIAAYINAFITATKKYNCRLSDIAQYSQEARQLVDLGLISKKCYIYYIVFSKHPLLTKAFRAIRNLLCKLRKSC